MTNKRKIDYEEALFRYQDLFTKTLRKTYLNELYFLLIDYLKILCRYKKLNEESASFVSYSLAGEISLRFIEEECFSIKKSWKSYLLKRMNFYLQAPVRANEKDSFVKYYLKTLDYNFMHLDISKNGIILLHIRRLIHLLVDLVSSFYTFDMTIFRYYFFLMIKNNSDKCLLLLKKKSDETLRSILIYTFNLYNYKLRQYLIRGMGAIDD